MISINLIEGRRPGGPFRQAFGKLEKVLTSSSTGQLHEPRRTSIPAERSFFFSAAPMNPQMSFGGFSSRMRSHNRFALERSRG